jgi:two-component system sensor histidine kinase BaeS
MIFSYIRRHLGMKLFLSYVVVILVGVVVLASTAELLVPTAFDRHLAIMSRMMSNMMGNSPAGLDQSLFTNFRAAVTEALGFAALAASAMAVITSIFISRQVVSPLQEMMSASQRIADGNYGERVRVSGNIPKKEQDELGQLALSFNQMAAKLEKTETMRRQLIGDVTHELRTPLTTIKGYMEGLIDGVLPSNEETYTHIYREADRLQHLVNDLQELSRVEAGAYVLHRQDTTAKNLVDTALARLNRQFEEKGVAVSTHIPDGLPSVSVDADRMGQVLLNLLGNALQYTPSGGSVDITAALQPGEVHISISDTGIGIPPEHLHHIFTRFYRVDKSRSRSGGGSGIGLTIAKFLVEAHSGRIWVESRGAGKGSTFNFTIPLNSTR